MLLYNLEFSQDNVATRFLCGKIFNNNFVANCLQNLPVKMFENWLRNDKDIDIACCTPVPAATVLHELFKKVWTGDHVPSEWKEGIITSLYKGKGAKTDRLRQTIPDRCSSR